MGSPATKALDRWRELDAHVNGRTFFGMAGVRDPDATCDVFEPTDAPGGDGDCETDGHYMCSECTKISLRALRRRRDECEDCGTKLELDPGNRWARHPEWCPKCAGEGRTTP